MAAASDILHFSSGGGYFWFMSVFLILCGLFYLYFSCFDKDVRLRFPALVRSAAVCCASGCWDVGVLWRRAGAVRCAARGGGGCAAGRSSPGELQRVVLSAFYAARALAVARRAEVPLASYSGWCFQRFTPRGVLRCHGTCGALRPLFLLRSCVADQEKRPEKKSWALMACAPVQLERPGNTCIRSAPRCISRGQREEGIFLRGRDFGDRFWELGFWSLCCGVGRSSAGGLQRRVFPPLCAARGTALSRGLRSAAAAFLASLMRR